MQKITRQTIDDLLAKEIKTPVVTMYIPTHIVSTPPHMTEDQIRFKNLFHQAADRLKEQGKEPFANFLLQQLDELQADNDFWLHQSRGVLVCAIEGNVRMFSLPIDTEEYVAVGDSYYLAPILGMVDEDQSFYVLAVTQHNPRLFIGNMYGLEPSAIQLPETIEAALNIDEENAKTENQSSARGSSINTTAFNGRGGAKNPHEENKMRFFRIIDSIVFDAADRSLPLILAGVDAEIAEYRSITKYPHVLSSVIGGSHGNTHPQDLYENARSIIDSEIIAAKRQAAIEDYEQMSGASPQRTAHDRHDIEKAAEQGRIDKLLVRLTRHTTDTVRDDTGAVDRITFPEPHMQVTINRLALKVWQMSGSVINLAANKIPNGAPMVARLRY